MTSTKALRERAVGLRPPLTPPARLHLQQPAPSTVERIALECLGQIAREGRCANLPELCAATGLTYQSGAVPALLRRLVEKGYIEHVAGVPLQRGLWVRICGTNMVTAEPANWAVHWQFNKDRVPTPTIQAIREKAKPIASMIEAEARLLGKSLTDFLADLVYIGWHTYQAEKETE